MKKLLFLIGGLLSSMAITAQVINYNQAGVLFTSEDINGTARYNAMSGAFGALGGDLSAVDGNPAGLAVFKKTQFSGSLGVLNTDVFTNFYGVEIENNTSNFNLNQLGGVLVFNGSRHSDTRKMAIGINYSITKNFENSWTARGNSSFAPITDFYDPDVEYGIPNEQTFRNFTDGTNKKLVLTFASQPNDKLYFGASLVTYDLDYYQNTITEEFNEDTDGNTFDVSAQEELFTAGSGIAFNVGLIAKPSQEVRLGLAYQSPTWYEVSEELVVYDDELFFNDQLDAVSGIASNNVFDYTLVTPSKVTGSFAYLFGREGLISFDYSYKDYSNIKLKPNSEFLDENQEFNDGLKATSQFKVGAEWRIDNVSLRGGYSYEESPYEDAIDTDNISGYSLGLGFKLNGGMKLDLAYQHRNNTDVYNFLNVDGADPVELDINNDKITATLVIGF
jgi:long-subunit fatty acid transport protein